jgi:hypothetical protein
VFLSERRAPISPAGFRKLIARVGEAGEFPFPVHPHMFADIPTLFAQLRAPAPT